MPEPRTVAPAHLPSPAEVHVLQAVKEYPSVSLLMTTEPGAVLARADVLKLQALAAQATARVRGELSPTVTGPVLARLAELVEQACDGPAAMSLAVYASASTGAVVRLPIPVSDRAVVDPTFATRDLVRALHRTPRHLVLALNSGAARLFDCIGDSLLPALTDDFPLTAKRRDSSVRGRADRPGRTADAAGETDFYRDVDDALGAYLRLHPAPLVLVGDPRATATFQRMSRNCQRLAGSVRGNLVNAPAPSCPTGSGWCWPTTFGAGRTRRCSWSLAAREWTRGVGDACRLDRCPVRRAGDAGGRRVALLPRSAQRRRHHLDAGRRPRGG
jgi:hypothetical protein